MGLHALLAALTALIVVPVVVLFVRFDWSPYVHFATNYRFAWHTSHMGQYLLNSLLVSLLTVGLIVLLAPPAAYALTRTPFPGRRWVYAVLALSMAVPGFLLITPLFLTLKELVVGPFSFSNSRIGISLIYAALALPFSIFLLSAFYRTLPSELAEAAIVDGASSWGVFRDIYFPLSSAGLATVAIFNFLAVWNEYNLALIFLTNPHYRTLSVGLYYLSVSQRYAQNQPALLAGVVILCVPTFAIFLLLQERIVAGLTAGSLKQ